MSDIRSGFTPSPVDQKRFRKVNGRRLILGALTLALFFGISALGISCTGHTAEPVEDLLSASVPSLTPSATATLFETEPLSPTPTLLPTSTPFPTDTPIPTATASPTARPTATAEPIAEPQPITEVILDVDFDYTRKLIRVRQEISYVNGSPFPLTEIPLINEPNRTPSLFFLESFDGSAENPITLIDQDGSTNLLFELDRPLRPGETQSIRLEYTLIVPLRKAPFGATDRQINFGDWYPFVPPLDANGAWIIQEPHVIGEHLVYDLADFDVTINLIDPPDSLRIAASGLQSASATTHRYELKNARNFAWAASPEFEEFDDLVGDVRVRSFYFPEQSLAGASLHRTTIESLSLFSGLLTDYPHPELVVSVVDFPDGREYDGLYFQDKRLYDDYLGSQEGYLTAIAAHETAHMWWYGRVGTNQATDPWIDEALSTYSELLYYETYYPDSVPWWWQIRVERFSPAGDVGQSIYAFDGFRPYVDTVYLNGVLFLHDLRNRLGDDLFFDFLRTITIEKEGQLLTEADFWALLARYPVDVAELQALYFE